MNEKKLKILAFGDLAGKKEVLKKLSDRDLSLYDFVLFTGDIPNPEVFKRLSKKRVVEESRGLPEGKPNIAEETEPKEALRQANEEFREVQGLFKKIQEKVRLVGVWGNSDNTKILRKVPLEHHVEILHNKVIEIREFSLIGYNGRSLYIFEKENKEQWAFSEEEVYTNLEKLFQTLKGEKVILITHAPPYGILDQVMKEYRDYAVGTYGERARKGHIGSVSLKRITDKYRPILHVFSHVCESKGVFCGKTVFVNIGSAGRSEELAEISIGTNGIKTIFKKV